MVAPISEHGPDGGAMVCPRDARGNRRPAIGPLYGSTVGRFSSRAAGRIRGRPPAHTSGRLRMQSRSATRAAALRAFHHETIEGGQTSTIAAPKQSVEPPN